MAQPTPTSNEGELGKTPIAHLLVYAVERQLTGVLSIAEPGQEPTRIRLARGVPVKVRAGDGFALFGRMLIEAGAIDERTLQDALTTKGLLGDVLMLAGRVDRNILEAVAEKQFLRRMVHLFEFSKGAQFRYEDGSAELLDWGGEPANVDPLFLLWRGVKAHGSSALPSTLAALGDAHLPLHPSTRVLRFGFTEDERLLVDHLAACPSSIAELVEFDLVPKEQAERLVYLLAITRSLELGAGTLPLGVETLRDGRSASQIVAKVALRPVAHRSGAAAPDLPGDGERAPVSRRSRTNPELRPAPAALAAMPASQLMEIAVESTPISTPEELIPTQVQPKVGREAAPERSRSITERMPRRAMTEPLPRGEPMPTGVTLPMPRTPIQMLGGGKTEPMPPVADAVTLLSPKHAALPPAVEPTVAALCALAREKLAAKDLAGALDAAERAARRRPPEPDALALAEHVRSLMAARPRGS